MDTPSQVQPLSSYPLARYYPQAQSGIVLALASYFIYLKCDATNNQPGLEPILPAGALGKQEFSARLDLGDEKFFVPELLPLVQQKIQDLTNSTLFEISQDDNSILEFIHKTRAWKEAITKELQENPIGPTVATQEEVALAVASINISAHYDVDGKPLPPGVLTKEQVIEIMSRRINYYLSPPLRLYEKAIQDLTGFYDWKLSYERECDVLPKKGSVNDSMFRLFKLLIEQDKILGSNSHQLN